MHYLAIIIGGIFINNYIFSRFLGLCPFLGVSKQLETATGMGMAVIFVMTMASAVAWLVQYFILVPLHLEYMQTIAFILVIAALVQFVEMVIMKISPVLYQALGIYLPLITTNCAVLGVALLNVTEGYNFLEAVINGGASAVGWTLAILLFAGIRERWAFIDIPPSMRGFPIALVSTGLMSIAFFGFQGLFRGILF
ncbi:MAG TPA: electron transport complex subunit RsxA [Firmicutes bacterium]|jgi:electron transport complex protein RnfA|uniref:electron transport complex subunit RsxA n=1 Tax=Gelria sp. Kuro-4 TaxID=2796927 RepID=UPI00198D8B7F|nr:electron transport complex subunit RsxA [Gelria sp. Kuro-4]MDI3522183.1 H+/Na+-translocating ferredoxin:NAD+ oxidoreductase subunit [Bacillota bacterium]MDK2927027.1 H+/Na+-translocating ferredoxin:NAD+ oxidoreductase subunit [Bacillota bacterium]BCV25792.1 electron transport complex subunit RsxA [Gelria sp. Kuro-4]HHV57691.1 electron transport complex subunit RsxA [Bacillota bacterium]